ncbi:MAG: iron-containing alcohol dehydrogenase [Tenericutes bacterium]|nr:iron-containing alcohol dehydrogenase [Mycoplasmatota bacterium]
MNFKLSNPTRLYFGDHAMSNLEVELHDATRILLVYGGKSIKKTGLYDNVIGILKNLDKSVYELASVPPNPTLEKVYEGEKICKENNVDYILAVGGGSVIDCAKAVAVAARYEGDIWDVIKHKVPVSKKIPLGTILTNSATSSENNYYSVISNTKTEEKIGWAIWPLNHPEFSIVNPKFMVTVPIEHTVYGIVDIMSHMIENYFHNKDIDSPIIAIQDRHLETMLKYMIELGVQLVNDPTNVELRESIAYIGTQALSTHSRHMLEGDWACHAIEHAISAVYDIPHGGGLAIVIPHWMKHVIHRSPLKFEMFASNVMNLVKGDETDIEFGLRGIMAFIDFLKTIDAPLKLSYYKIDNSRIIDMVEKSLGSQSTIGKFVNLNDADVHDILNACL